MAQPLFRIKAAAQQVGISEQLLRMWERRYHVVTPQRGPSGYRGYSENDLALLKKVKGLLAQGFAIGDVAPMLPELRREVKAEGPAPAPVTSSDGPRVEAWRRDALAAAEAVDQGRVEAVLDEALATLPPLVVVEQLFVPLQREVGDRWHAGTLTVAQEHLVTHAVRSRMVALLNAAPRTGQRVALCACFPEEQHDLGLLTVALKLRYAGYRVTYLGPRTPLEQLAEAAERLSPSVVTLSLTTEVSRASFKRSLEKLKKALPGGVRVLVGGLGAQPHADVTRALKLEAVPVGEWPFRPR